MHCASVFFPETFCSLLIYLLIRISTLCLLLKYVNIPNFKLFACSCDLVINTSKNIVRRCGREDMELSQKSFCNREILLRISHANFLMLGKLPPTHYCIRVITIDSLLELISKA